MSPICSEHWRLEGELYLIDPCILHWPLVSLEINKCALKFFKQLANSFKMYITIEYMHLEQITYFAIVCLYNHLTRVYETDILNEMEAFLNSSNYCVDIVQEFAGIRNSLKHICELEDEPLQSLH